MYFKNVLILVTFAPIMSPYCLDIFLSREKASTSSSFSFINKESLGVGRVPREEMSNPSAEIGAE